MLNEHQNICYSESDTASTESHRCFVSNGYVPEAWLAIESIVYKLNSGHWSDYLALQDHKESFALWNGYHSNPTMGFQHLGKMFCCFYGQVS